jgi:hypothetical protein
MVEFAMVGPILFVMLFALMEGGWLLFHNHQVSNAAREGARFAVVNGEMSGAPTDAAAIRDHIADRVSVSNWDSLEVRLIEVDGNMEPESRVRVEIDYTHQTFVGFIISRGTIDLSSSSTMRIHY